MVRDCTDSCTNGLGYNVQQLLADQRAAEQRDEEAVELLLEMGASGEGVDQEAAGPTAKLARWAVRSHRGVANQRNSRASADAAAHAEEGLNIGRRVDRPSLHKSQTAQNARKVCKDGS